MGDSRSRRGHMKLKLYTNLAALVVGVVLSSTPYAANSEIVNLIATTNNTPIFKPVSWQVYRIDQQGKKTLVSDDKRKHIVSLNMIPGRYSAIATVNNKKSGEYKFTVKANTPRDLFIPIN